MRFYNTQEYSMKVQHESAWFKEAFLQLLFTLLGGKFCFTISSLVRWITCPNAFVVAASPSTVWMTVAIIIRPHTLITITASDLATRSLTTRVTIFQSAVTNSHLWTSSNLFRLSSSSSNICCLLSSASLARFSAWSASVSSESSPTSSPRLSSSQRC